MITLTVTENLITAGMPDAQAKAIAKEYANLMQHHVDQFATKEDIKLLRDELQSDIQHVRSDLQHVEERLDAKIERLYLRLIVYIGGMIATAAGLIMSMMKLLIV